MKEKWTARKIRATKGTQPLCCLTAGDYVTARLIDEQKIPLILVGDSLAMTMLGYETTLPVTVEEMLHHTAAVVRGVKQALVVADMPFMSYQISREQALQNAGRFVKEAGADAVKLEGGAFRAETVSALVQNGIPVLGHIGLTPQSVRETGGYKIQGRQPEAATRLMDDARALQAAGVFAMVLECVPAELGAQITQALDVPVIGIGAGAACDGQIMVYHDLVGLTSGPRPRFVRTYASLAETAANAVAAFAADVAAGAYPNAAESYE